MNVECIAVAGVGVRQQRNAGTIGKRGADPQVFIKSENAAVGSTQEILGNAGAADRGRLITRPLDEPDTEAVEHAGQNQNFRRLNHPAESSSVDHLPPILEIAQAAGNVRVAIWRSPAPACQL